MQRRGFQPDVISHVAVISTCGKRGLATRALQIFGGDAAAETPARCDHLHCMDQCMRKLWDGNESLAALCADVLRRRLQPNLTTYNALSSACRKGGMAAKALQLVEEMEQQGLARCYDRQYNQQCVRKAWDGTASRAAL